jgi:hypothetical protein
MLLIPTVISRLEGFIGVEPRGKRSLRMGSQSRQLEVLYMTTAEGCLAIGRVIDEERYVKVAMMR